MFLLDSRDYNSAGASFLMKNQYSGRLCRISPRADPALFPVPSSERDTHPEPGSGTYSRFLSVVGVAASGGKCFLRRTPRRAAQQLRSAGTAAASCRPASPGAPGAGRTCPGQQVRTTILRVNNCAIQQKGTLKHRLLSVTAGRSGCSRVVGGQLALARPGAGLSCRRGNRVTLAPAHVSDRSVPSRWSTPRRRRCPSGEGAAP